MTAKKAITGKTNPEPVNDVLSDYYKMDITLPGSPPATDEFSFPLYRCLLRCELKEPIDSGGEPDRVFADDIFQHEANAAYQAANYRGSKGEGGFIPKLTVFLPRESYLTHYYMSFTVSLETFRHFINAMMHQITCGFKEPEEDWQEWYTHIKTEKMEIVELTPVS
jgi:hypothetical protein